MTYYDSFDCEINCEEFYPFTEAEWEEFLLILAEECLEGDLDTEEAGL